MVIDRLAGDGHVAVDGRRWGALIGEWLAADEKIVLAKPQLFMNHSGVAVRELLAAYQASAEDLVVVYDDLDLPFGRLRIRPQGRAAGHRGVLSIQESLVGAPFCRVRVGIGRPPEGVDPVDYVLEPFSAAEQEVLAEVIDRSAAAVKGIISEGIERAMGRFNRAP